MAVQQKQLVHTHAYRKLDSIFEPHKILQQKSRLNHVEKDGFVWFWNDVWLLNFLEIKVMFVWAPQPYTQIRKQLARERNRVEEGNVPSKSRYLWCQVFECLIRAIAVRLGKKLVGNKISFNLTYSQNACEWIVIHTYCLLYWMMVLSFNLCYILI